MLIGSEMTRQSDALGIGRRGRLFVIMAQRPSLEWATSDPPMNAIPCAVRRTVLHGFLRLQDDGGCKSRLVGGGRLSFLKGRETLDRPVRS